jgi:hypothetical protein
LDFSKIVNVPSSIFTLPYSGTLNSNATGITVANTGTGVGLVGQAVSGNGVVGESTYGDGVRGTATHANGVFGYTTDGSYQGVYGVNPNGVGVYGQSGGNLAGVFGYNSGQGYGGWFVSAGGISLRADGLAQIGVLEITGGADLAEKFEVRGSVHPGMVVEIDPFHPGSLRLTKTAYSKRVAGILSGAKQLKAGMVLTGAKGSHAVSLSGRVWVQADARQRAIEPGDLLTTSTLPGHARVASDAKRSHGAILGKAMTALRKGKIGMVLTLVNLQ